MSGNKCCVFLVVSGALLTATLKVTPANVAYANELQNPKLGSPSRTELLDALRATEPMVATAKEWKIPKVTFYDVTNLELNEWAYVKARPGSADNKHTTEPVQCVIHRVRGEWHVVDYVSDEVAPADDPDAAFKKWHEKFVKEHTGCPAEIFPAKF